MIMAMALSSLWLLVKPWSNNNNNYYNANVNNKDVVVASASRNNDDHNVIFFAPVTVAITAADKGVTHLHRCLLTSTPLHPRSADDHKDNDTSIVSASKNNKDHVR
jgi:hypothetical protein